MQSGGSVCRMRRMFECAQNSSFAQRPIRTITKVLVELMIRGAQRGRVIRKESVRGNLKREGETGAQRRLPRPLVVPSHICAPRPAKINDRTQDKERMTKTIRIKINTNQKSAELMKSQIRAPQFLLSDFRLYKRSMCYFVMGEAALFCKRGLPPNPYLPKSEREGSFALCGVRRGALPLDPANF